MRTTAAASEMSRGNQGIRPPCRMRAQPVRSGCVHAGTVRQAQLLVTTPPRRRPPDPTPLSGAGRGVLKAVALSLFAVVVLAVAGFFVVGQDADVGDRLLARRRRRRPAGRRSSTARRRRDAARRDGGARPGARLRRGSPRRPAGLRADLRRARRLRRDGGRRATGARVRHPRPAGARPLHGTRARRSRRGPSAATRSAGCAPVSTPPTTPPSTPSCSSGRTARRPTCRRDDLPVLSLGGGGGRPQHARRHRPVPRQAAGRRDRRRDRRARPRPVRQLRRAAGRRQADDHRRGGAGTDRPGAHVVLRRRRRRGLTRRLEPLRATDERLRRRSASSASPRRGVAADLVRRRAGRCRGARVHGRPSSRTWPRTRSGVETCTRPGATSRVRMRTLRRRGSMADDGHVVVPLVGDVRDRRYPRLPCSPLGLCRASPVVRLWGRPASGYDDAPPGRAGRGVVARGRSRRGGAGQLVRPST